MGLRSAADTKPGAGWRRFRGPFRLAVCGACAVILCSLQAREPVQAQNNPPRNLLEQNAGQSTGGIDSGVLPPIGGVDAGELPPVAGSSAVGVGFSGAVWNGVTVEAVESLAAGINLPSRSPALASLWRRLLLSENGQPTGGRFPEHFLSLRAEGFYRAGMLEDADRVLAGLPPGTKRDAQLGLLSARNALALGRTDDACGIMKSIPLGTAKLSKPARNDAILLTAYCVSKDKQPQNASLAAEVTRDQGVKAPLVFAVLNAMAESKTAKLPKVTTLSLFDYKFLALLGPIPSERLGTTASADVLVAQAADTAGPSASRLAAIEAAARLNAVTAEQVVALYVDADVPDDVVANPLASAVDGPTKRAALYRAASIETAPKRRLQLVAGFLEEARRDGLLPALAPVAAGLIANVPPDNDVLWFAEPAVETLVAAGQYDRAMPWIVASGGSLLHWTLLIDIADPSAAVPVDSALGYAERMVQDGELTAPVVQRLATVLDALEYNVPIGIWDAAQRAPVDSAGHLPATGQLSALQEASKARDVARTVLLTLSAYGPDTPDVANLLTLGDTIRALRAAGLDSDARRLALEALLPNWPHKAGG
jgi:hypothetical protein